MTTTMDALRARAEAVLDEVLADAYELRRRLHRQPRVGGDEHDTRDLLRAELASAGITDVVDVVEGCLVRVGGDEAPAVAIRAELDGLPIQEISGVPWASECPGVAHLCGHDVHLAALVATLRVVDRLRDGLADGATLAPLLGVFQPREEVIPPGAVDFVPRPELAPDAVLGIVGVHVQPVMPAGTFSAEAGPINASADNFDVVVHGRPAHGAYPHLGRDPIVAASAVVLALQQLVSRRSDPMNPAVVTVGRIAGGDSPNAISGEVRLYGTVRAYDDAHRQQLHRDLREVSEAAAAAYGCAAEVSIGLGEPVLDNDAHLATVVSEALRTIGLTPSRPLRSCGADDFSYYGTSIPSLMVFAGVEELPGRPGLHHPAFVPGDESVRHVARIMLASYLALALAQSQPDSSSPSQKSRTDR